MKRPGGFDREPERNQEPVRPEPVRPEPRLEPATGAPPAARPESVVSPDEQPTEVIGDDQLPLEGSGGTTSAVAMTSDTKQAVSRALAWVGVGAPRDPVRAADRRLRQAARSRRGRERRERRRFAGQLRRQRRGWLIAGGAVVALALFVAVCTFTPLTAVRDVRIEGAQAVPQDDLARALARFDGVPLALVDDTQVHRALEVFPLVQRYQIERIPPHTLVVQIEERVPVIAIERNGTFEQFDAAGVKVGVGETAPDGVPVGSAAITDLASPAFAEAARIVRDMPQELRARVTGVTASSAQDVTLTLENGLQVMWGGDADTRRKAVVLQTMLKALGDRPIEHIDVSSPDAPVFR